MFRGEEAEATFGSRRGLAVCSLNPARRPLRGTFLMSFLKHGEIYPFDEGAVAQAASSLIDRMSFGLAILGGLRSRLPASASPAGEHLAMKRLRCTIKFQRTANSVLTVCLSPGDNPGCLL